MKHLPVFCLGISIAMFATLSLRAADDMDPEKIAMDELKKATSEPAKSPPPNVAKMLEDAKKQAEKDDEPDATPTPAPATKPQPLKALPDWIPAVPGFKPSPGATHWTEAGKEMGQMTGVISSPPRDVSDNYHAIVKAANKLNISTTDATINGALTITINVTNREGDERKLELTLKPSPDGKSSLATFEYSAALPGAKPPANQ